MIKDLESEEIELKSVSDVNLLDFDDDYSDFDIPKEVARRALQDFIDLQKDENY